MEPFYIPSKIFALIIILALALSVARKVRAKEEDGGEIIWARLLLVLSMIFYDCTILVEILQVLIDMEDINIDLEGLVGIVGGISVATSLVFAFYINDWEYSIYAPYIFYIGCLALFLLDGIYFFLQYFLIIGGLLSNIFLLQASISVKDNKTLGLALFYISALIAGVVATILDITGTQLETAIYVTGIVLITIVFFDKFTPFKMEAEYEEEVLN